MRKDRTDIILLDSVYSLYIRERDGNVCLLCGSKRRLTDSHLITRQLTSVRWHELNNHCHCWGCNKRHEHHPEVYTVWFLKKYGVEKYIELYQMSLKYVPLPDEAQIKAMHEKYTEKLESLLKVKNGRHKQMC